MSNVNWYTVSGLFRWYFKNTGETANFEDRHILIRATNFDEALDKAELEALEYCVDSSRANFSIESLGKHYAYEISEDELENGIEVFSRRFESNLSGDEYIKTNPDRYINKEN